VALAPGMGLVSPSEPQGRGLMPKSIRRYGLSKEEIMDTLAERLAEHTAQGERACDALDRAVRELRRLRRGVSATTRSALAVQRPGQGGGGALAVETGGENAGG
jgi:hypothetical protein